MGPQVILDNAWDQDPRTEYVPLHALEYSPEASPTLIGDFPVYAVETEDGWILSQQGIALGWATDETLARI